ncbi:MAG: cysteine synthase family protein [Bradymonadaceae bacterium]|nr:cysteine synthase family protein [Lujinxingiaceae bacterium]
MSAHLPKSVEVWVKLESMNPGGSVKDRPARQIITEAIERGDLGDGKILIDATSGNTGIAYAMIGAAMGIEVHLVMPGNVSAQRKHIVETYGAKIIYSDPMDGSDGAIRLVRDIVAADSANRYYYANQYGNPSNPRAHELTTAPEIWQQTAGRITHFLASTGTSGTIMGTGRGLKGFNRDVRVIGCQPSDAFHGLEGLKHMPTSIVPAIYKQDELDEVMFIETEDGWDTAERLAKEEGIGAGNSAGANVYAALKIARTLESGVLVTVICDHADRYFGE